MQQPPAEYLHHGQIPFFRLAAAEAGRLPEGTRAVLMGVPYDGGTTYQPGARLAPWHVRRVSALVQGHHPVHGVDVFERVRVIDGGNVVFPPFSPQAMREEVEREVAAVLRSGATPFLVGGDHSVALPALRAVAQVHGVLAIAHIDAHLDTSGPEVWGDAFHHGTPMRHALEDGLVERGQLHQIGIRGPWSRATDGLVGAHRGARVHTAEEIAERGAARIAAEVRRAVGERPVYLSLDIDAVDPAFAPGTGIPVPAGLTSREVIQLLRGLAGIRLVGMDLVEVCPALDHADLTSHLAAHLLFEGLALLAMAPPHAG